MGFWGFGNAKVKDSQALRDHRRNKHAKGALKEYRMAMETFKCEYCGLGHHTQKASMMHKQRCIAHLP